MDSRIFRYGTLALLAAVAFVTLAPISDRPFTGFAPIEERFVAYLLIGFVASLGFPKHRLRTTILLVLVAGGLEALQRLTSTRHGMPLDFVVKAAAAAIGMALAPVAVIVFDRLKSGTTTLRERLR